MEEEINEAPDNKEEKKNNNNHNHNHNKKG